VNFVGVWVVDGCVQIGGIAGLASFKAFNDQIEASGVIK
jgi:hypothetical protein